MCRFPNEVGDIGDGLISWLRASPSFALHRSHALAKGAPRLIRSGEVIRLGRREIDLNNVLIRETIYDALLPGRPTVSCDDLFQRAVGYQLAMFE
jgi:hypothetical protein